MSNQNQQQLEIQNISLFIPRIFSNISKEKIVQIFEKHIPIGKINHIDFVGVPDKNYNRAYIHFDYWYNTEYAYNFQKSIDSSIPFKVIYDKNWYWIVLENNYNFNYQYTTEDYKNMEEIECELDKNIEDEINYSYDDYEEYKDEYNEEDYKMMEELELSVQPNMEVIDISYIEHIEYQNKILYNELNRYYTQYYSLYEWVHNIPYIYKDKEEELSYHNVSNNDDDDDYTLSSLDCIF